MQSDKALIAYGRARGTTMKMRGICRVFATALFTVSAVLLESAGAQDLLSGHIGVATPIVTYTVERNLEYNNHRQ